MHVLLQNLRRKPASKGFIDKNCATYVDAIATAACASCEAADLHSSHETAPYYRAHRLTDCTFALVSLERTVKLEASPPSGRRHGCPSEMLPSPCRDVYVLIVWRPYPRVSRRPDQQLHEYQRHDPLSPSDSGQRQNNQARCGERRRDETSKGDRISMPAPQRVVCWESSLNSSCWIPERGKRTNCML